MLRRYNSGFEVVFGLAISSLLSGIILYSMAPETKWIGVIGSLGIFVFSGWVFLIPTLSQCVKDQWKIGNDEIEAIKSTFLSQDIIDGVLCGLAKKFDEVCRKQIQLQGESTAEGALELQARLIRQTKSNFWTTCDLAKRLGFKVATKYNRYLNFPVVYD